MIGNWKPSQMRKISPAIAIIVFAQSGSHLFLLMTPKSIASGMRANVGMTSSGFVIIEVAARLPKTAMTRTIVSQTKTRKRNFAFFETYFSAVSGMLTP